MQAVGTTGLSLATPLVTLLKTAVCEPFFLTINAFIKTRSQSIFLHPNQTGDFSDAHGSFASEPEASQMSAENMRYCFIHFKSTNENETI